MKKTIALFLLIAIIGLSACAGDTAYNQQETAASTTGVASNVNTEATGAPMQGATKTENDIGGGEIVQEKYRQCYYNISYQLSLLVDENELRTWEEETYAKDPNETNEMVVKLFVQHFNISKEDFERANLESVKVLCVPDSPLPSMNPKDYINQEMYEIYNADIIYTFDDEIINEYYLSGEYPFVYESDYEEAVASGEYTPRTEKWIDIEEMEAEIIAKYGEAEIVTEATLPDSETAGTDSTQSEIPEETTSELINE